MHDAEVNDRLDVAGPEDVLQLLPPDVDLGVLDVLRLVEEGAAVHAHDAPLAVEHAGQVLAETTADARDEDGAAGVSHERLTRRCASAP